MKKLLRVFALLACVATMGIMSSCTKSNEDLIVGKWELVTIENDGTIYGREAQDLTDFWRFTADGTWIMYYKEERDQGNYKINGDKLFLYEDGYYSELHILELSESKMILNNCIIYVDDEIDRSYENCIITFKKV